MVLTIYDANFQSYENDKSIEVEENQEPEMRPLLSAYISTERSIEEETLFGYLTEEKLSKLANDVKIIERMVIQNVYDEITQGQFVLISSIHILVHMQC